MLRTVFALAITIAAGLLIIILLLKTGLSDSQQSAQQRYQLSHFAKLSASNSIKLTELARQYVVTLQPSYKKQYYELVNQIEGTEPWLDGRKKSYIDRLKEFNVNEQELALLNKSNSLSLQLVSTEEQAFQLVSSFAGQSPSLLNTSESKQWVQAIGLLTDKGYMDEVAKIQTPVQEFLAAVENSSLQEVMNNNNRVANLSLISIVMVLVIITILILCYLQLEKRVIKTTTLLVNEAQRIANGDLTHKIAHSGNDEIAELSASFNIMIDKLSTLLSEINSQSQQAQIAANELDSIAQQARLLNDEQSQAIEVISSSVYENSTAVKEVSKNCSEAAQNAGDADAKTQAGIDVVNQSIHSVESVAEILTESINDLNDLESSVNEVAVILNVISNIAEQTNLLALNAAIEAARAGEQGRGFAVVADEVRTLASRTQSSTVEIQQKINSLQSASNAVTERIRSSDTRVKDAVSNSEKVGSMLKEISTQVRLISDANRTIAAASEQQAQVTEDIAERLTGIQDASMQSKSQTAQISSSSSELAQVAINLNTQINKFKLS
ncbi:MULTISPECIES: methyl-accepting chemotaxis protein [Pseudoalteromonas]|uniref:methyl-accepting chemotaxis protein n=1 Tax=Pseudoalteromonas TaxID=53246 RepID=UPI00123126EA|nr:MULTISPECIES: methyl-accepting chemotaxis protein [Pseudoalteromonas]MBB1309285.1 methyl-accepting chemotaxis protein [Pseudoalteromonas sp. SR41-8]|tara:strand:+ start:12716 stop:14377 length:1662 start_codon:yes stop_codon:yes gene_type:complete